MRTVEERILAKKDLFVQMWNDNETSEYIATVFSVSGATVNSYGERFGLPRRCFNAQCHTCIEDNPKDAALRFAEIAISERKAAIQQHWDDETEYTRRVQRPAEFCVSRLAWTHEGFAEVGPAESHPMINTDMMNKLIKESGYARKSHSGFFNERARKAS